MLNNKLIFFVLGFLFTSCGRPKEISESVELRLQKRTSQFLEKSIGAWKASDSVNYALVDSSSTYLFKVIYSDYVLTDTVKLKRLDDDIFIYPQNSTLKMHYKVNVLDQLVSYDDLGNPFQTYESLK